MLTITKRREHKIVTTYTHLFTWVGERNCGFSFDVDEHGDLASDTAPAARANHAACLTGIVDGRPVVDQGIQALTHVDHVPAEGTCACGRTVVLYGDTGCRCGRLYNSGGQELNPPHLWEEPWDED